jgi:hypothetical protein
MGTDRNSILHLVALGRLHPVQAERLLIACNEGGETAAVLAAGLILAFLSSLNLHQGLPTFLHIARELLTHTVHRTVQSLLPLL